MGLRDPLLMPKKYYSVKLINKPFSQGQFDLDHN